MEVGGYSMHLYCDNTDQKWPDGKHGFEQFPEEFDAETRGQCVRAARQKGWLFKKDGTHLCPKCSGKPTVKVTAGG